MDSFANDQLEHLLQPDLAADGAHSNLDWGDATALMATLTVACSNKGPKSTARSESEIRQEAEARSETIYTSYDTLHRILERHEATISKRWLKRTRQQRLKVLLEAWPDMPAVHRPDLDTWRKGAYNPKRARAPRCRDCFMWPYINQEDLVSPKVLLLLLNSRGRNPPSSFAAADIDAMQFGLVSRALDLDTLRNHQMALNGFVDNNRQYGELVTCHDDNDKEFTSWSLKQFMPGEGLLVLEAQARLLTFLVQCCHQLLSDIPVDNFDSFPILPPPQTQSETELSGFESLRLMAAEAPYRVPAQLDLSRIASLLAARTSAAEDHQWALREDPDYFASVVLDMAEHTPEMLKDLQGRDHPDLRGNRKNIIWARVLACVVCDAFLKVETFNELSQQARALVSLQHQYASQISPSQSLPEEFLTALLRFRHDLGKAVHDPLKLLRMTFRPSPPFRRFFMRAPTSDSLSSQFKVEERPGVKPTAVEKKLLWVLGKAFDNGMVLVLAGVPLLMDELERLLDNEPGARGMITPFLAGVIGDLSILAHPWYRIVAGIDEALPVTIVASRAVALGDPSGGKFAYPIDKRRTKEHVKTLRQAEARLDAFWEVIDRVIGDRVQGTVSQKVFPAQSRSLHRTPEWEEPSLRPQPQLAPRPKNEGIDLYPSFETVAPTPSKGLSTSSADDNSTAQPPKIKVKTRGTARPVSTQEDHDAEAPPEPIGAEIQPKFAVDARSLKVFRGLFHDPEVTATPGEMRWTDFLHATSSIGFASIKLYGSVWQFQPTDMNFDRSIQFHEPHPHGKLSYTAARRIGRRLTRAYGWHGDMFVLAE
ncbi:uncharacterized protein BO72DRAFT_518830 [Aspergillus fijiensis CBS 313.89]|uniref:Uncharacterized protein n=1 Tax=Aspergillus fijiensis CBS 313.89 TaxID=1448319 RepID=A0A8G1W2A3_9EURO|nr:uncharacterized protein BO72DRAFT_518830 [Aspergillus fijiensis CBS 313.89]RAK81302.1 hypothetical protein BO72DRAFT_518830 [Aspergillus fijiensis CBS 313.89]